MPAAHVDATRVISTFRMIVLGACESHNRYIKAVLIEKNERRLSSISSLQLQAPGAARAAPAVGGNTKHFSLCHEPKCPPWRERRTCQVFSLWRVAALVRGPPELWSTAGCVCVLF